MKNIKIKSKPLKMTGKISMPKESPAQTASRLQDESRKMRAKDKQKDQSGTTSPSK